jgi:hypothetical protein
LFFAGGDCAGPTPAVGSGGGHGYINGQGSLDGGQRSLTVDDDASVPGTGRTSVATATDGQAATGGVALALQRTKKFPSLPLSTGFMSYPPGHSSPARRKQVACSAPQ